MGQIKETCVESMERMWLRGGVARGKLHEGSELKLPKKRRAMLCTAERLHDRLLMRTGDGTGPRQSR